MVLRQGQFLGESPELNDRRRPWSVWQLFDGLIFFLEITLSRTAADAGAGHANGARNGRPRRSWPHSFQELPTELPAIGPQLRIILTIGTKGCRFLMPPCSRVGIFSGDHFTPSAIGCLKDTRATSAAADSFHQSPLKSPGPAHNRRPRHACA